MWDPIRQFDELVAAPQGAQEGVTFSGVTIAGNGRRHLAKDAQCRPAVLLRYDDEARTPRPAPIALENLRVEYGVVCLIRDASGQNIEGRFVLIHCLTTDRALQEYFLRAIAVILDSLPQDADAQQVSDCVSKLVELFRAASRAPSRAALGLWAELFTIVSASDPLAMLRSWRVDSVERFDFSNDEERIEVKCSSDRTRRHHFSLEQAYPPSGGTVLIASLFVEHSGAGTALGELWDQARDLAGADADLRMKVESVCIQTLGNSWREARSRAYDRELAGQSLAFYDAREIPRVAEKQPPGVSEVQFRSDLSLATPLDVGTLGALGPLFNACFGALAESGCPGRRLGQRRPPRSGLQ